MFIEGVEPEIDCGQYPVKRIVGDRLTVEADLVADGHDVLAGVLRYRHGADAAGAWREVPLEPLSNDRWRGSFPLTELGRWQFTLEAWVDHLATWQRGLVKKVEAAAATEVDLMIGAALLEQAAERARGKNPHAAALIDAARALRVEGAPIADRAAAALTAPIADAAARYPDRRHASAYDRVLEVEVDRERARFSAWYEMFPRSCGPAGQHGTFRDAEKRLPYVAELGFDVLYLPPIHPIGRAHRKGKNNTLTTEPGDPGSPWAIGAAEGGHTAVHPELGTLADFRRFREAAERHGLELALDIAFQASPDHPWVKEHPSWFVRRPDGTIQYAENPPKKYQDIYPLDFESEDWNGLWHELRGVFSFWIEQGVRIFRVDNPHTKSLRFWGWCIAELKRRHPDVLFLSEAFTKPKLMYALAKLGFTQSYTYFTWRVSKHELIEYGTELTTTKLKEFFRPNFWPNTPDILPDHLQSGSRGAFVSRLVMAATLSSNYGIYGPAYELMDHVARPGSGEYLDNEKYQLRDWQLDRPDSLRHLIARLNRVRRSHPALQTNERLRFHHTDNDQLLCYSKRTPLHDDVVLVVVNLDPHHAQSGFVHLDLDELGLSGGQPFTVHDLISGARYAWQDSQNYVSLDAYSLPVHLFSVSA